MSNGPALNKESNPNHSETHMLSDSPLGQPTSHNHHVELNNFLVIMLMMIVQGMAGQTAVCSHVLLFRACG